MVKKLSEIRESFIDYFSKRGHKFVKSAPLIPHNDPSLMFVNAGMVPFKNYFTALEKPESKKIVSAQKCVRAGGKHNDLENVGYTARHHTFFEMLGNFSFGDYFKEEAIFYGYEYVTKFLELPKSKLIATIYHDDEEAYNLWKKIAGFTDSQIKRISTNDNFWSMGDVGPCGPCSEIFYDHGDKYKGMPPGEGDEGERYVEIWNLVFMQYEKQKDGTLKKLPNPAIDTGMGLERVASIMQGKHNNYDTDLFKYLISKSMDLASDKNNITSHRVIADHLRSISFLIADGVMPSNEGRGYVLRRIMRRAIRHANQVGAKDLFLSKLVPNLVERMGDHYSELQEAQKLITNIVANEEEQFNKTLAKGLKILSDALNNNQNKKKFSGEIAFKLYDTYGFPLDLTQDILRGQNISVNIPEFEKLMQDQKNRGKENWQGSGALRNSDFWFELEQKLVNINFTGYSKSSDNSEVIALIQNEEEVMEVNSGEFYLIAKNTPFYPESGGQIGDQGIIKTANSLAEITDTQKFANNLIIHFAKVKKGNFKINDKITLEIDHLRRNKIKANHSATHLLHKALQEILGSHISQKGSLVSDKLLRFDFSHNGAISRAEIHQIEDAVNHIIIQNNMVETNIMSIEEAKNSGAVALFGEKYDEDVRVLTMGNWHNSFFSKELCGGTHVKATGDIGLFKIISESSIASGIRRIEAITGEKALKYLQENETIIEEITDICKSPKREISSNIQNLINSKKALEKEIVKLKQKNAANIKEGEVVLLKKEKILFKIIEDLEAKDARDLAFQFKKQDYALIILISIFNNKLAVITLSNKVKLFDAVPITKKIVEKLGGKGGGGKADLAQGGAADISKIKNIKIEEII